jgi:dolichyl-phosphate-mannose-protein mannosyltransferase
LRFKRSKWLWLAPAGVILLALGIYSLFAKPAPKTDYGINLLKNGDFESISGEGLPNDWLPDAYLSIYGVSDFEVSDGQIGRGITIRNNDANDARFVQTVEVQPNTLYELSGYVRAKALDGRGANLSVMQVSAVSESLTDTQGNWQKLVIYGRTGSQQHEMTVYARLGGYSADSRGEASFDGLRLVALKEAPPGAFVESWEPWNMEAALTDDKPAASPKAFWPWLLVISALYIAYVRFASRSSERHALEYPQALGRPAWDKAILLLLALAAVTRMAMAALIPGYGVDIGCFTSWANEMYRVGPTQFYVSESFSDYPPGYMLVLWPLGFVGTGATVLW